MDRYLIDSVEYKGYTIKKYYDDSPECPRDWDNLGTIYSNHRHYSPDKHSIEEIMSDDDNKLSKEFLRDYIYLPIYGYEHGGLSISTSSGYPFNDRWDSGLFGIIAIKKTDAVKVYGKKICTKEVREKALDNLRAEIKTLNQYYNGEVYGYRVVDEEDDEIDSCWGFYDEEDMIVEAKSVVDCKIKNRERTKKENLEKVSAAAATLVGDIFPDGDDFYRFVEDAEKRPMCQKATLTKSRIRDEFFKPIALEELPEQVLTTIVKAV